MLQQCIGKRGIVRIILAENFLRGDCFEDLHQSTMRAKSYFQGIFVPRFLKFLFGKQASS
jgi:hypothetical protein